MKPHLRAAAFFAASLACCASAQALTPPPIAAKAFLLVDVLSGRPGDLGHHPLRPLHQSDLGVDKARVLFQRFFEFLDGLGKDPLQLLGIDRFVETSANRALFGGNFAAISSTKIVLKF